jgi:hypothetical protein
VKNPTEHVTGRRPENRSILIFSLPFDTVSHRLTGIGKMKAFIEGSKNQREGI